MDFEYLWATEMLRYRELLRDIEWCLTRYGNITPADARKIVEEDKRFDPPLPEMPIYSHETGYYWAMNILYAADYSLWWNAIPGSWPAPEEYSQHCRQDYAQSVWRHAKNTELSDEMLEEMLEDRNEEMRLAAIWYISVYNVLDARLFKRLLLMTHDSDKWIRTMAVIALCNWKEPAIADALTTLLHDAEAMLRGAAATALGELQDPRSVSQLIANVDDSQEFVSKAIIRAVGQFKTDEARDALISLLKNTDQHPRIKAAIIRSLGQFKTDEAREALIDVLKDPDQNTRGEAVRALFHIADDRDAQPISEAYEAALARGETSFPAIVRDQIRRYLRDKETNSQRSNSQDQQNSVKISS